ncbi:MAG: amidophosphoribosyltransferase, partial [Myxococcota bacterium]
MTRELREIADARADERPRDECGVVGVHGHAEASTIAYLGLYALQHRGQESAGICTSHGGEQFVHRAMGLVSDVFQERTLSRLPGRHAIGHVRYSTSGESRLVNAQPICANTDGGPVAIAHNGNLVNARAVRKELEGRGAIFSTTSDSEVVLHLLARSREATLEDRLIDALSRVKGAFSLVLLTHDSLIAVRDPSGFRPLTLGRLDGAWVVASETCALDLIGAEVERDLD